MAPRRKAHPRGRRSASNPKGLASMYPSARRHAVPRPVICLVWISVFPLFCQTIPSSNPSPSATGQAGRAIPAQSTPSQEQVPKRIFGIIPNYRSHPSWKDSKPLPAGEKFKLAARDSFDRGTFILVAGFAGLGQLTNSTQSYGQGMAGYGRYYGSIFGDFAIGNFMTEAVYPSLLHQDPRYFRLGAGSAWSRLRYAVGQIFITHGDNRRIQFNCSEICGNATASAISNAYNPNRTASDSAENLGIQLAVDMTGNILKEFTPDLYRKFRAKKRAPPYSGRP